MKPSGLIGRTLAENIALFDREPYLAGQTVRELAERLNRQAPTTEQVVWYGLGQLNELLEEPVALPNELAGVSRRHFLKMSGVVAAGVTLPLVVKLVAPSPAEAQSVSLLSCCRCGIGNSFTVADCALCLGECPNGTCTAGAC